jgi:hypothetical protein
MAKRTIIDPPEGWKYGFPKPIPFGEGYPMDMIPLAIKYSRYWEEDIPEEVT